MDRRISIQLTSAPAAEPVSLTEAKTHLRVEDTSDDTYITALITVAREYIEGITNLRLITQTVKERLDAFPYSRLTPLYLTLSPVQSITSVQYYDEDNAVQTWSASLYTTDIYQKPARLQPIDNEAWPTTYDKLSAVEVTYVVGYGNASTDVPGPIKQAILLTLTDLYENREDKVRKLPMASHRLLDPYRVFTF